MSISTVKPTTCTIFEFIEYHSTLVLISPWPDPPEKKIERSPFFVRRGGHCCRGDLVGQTKF